MRPLYIINENTRASNYGIGTYIQQLLKAVKGLPFKVHVIYLSDDTHTCLSVEEKEEVTYISLPGSHYITPDNNYEKARQRYYRNALYLLKPYFTPYAAEELLIHFNFLHAAPLAKILKEHFTCRIYLTVHYMNWSFDLLGDIHKLKKLLDSPDSEQEKQIKKSVEIEKSFINTYCDRVIAIAQHSYNTLLDVYDIPKVKMIHIANGLEDVYQEISLQKRNELRQKYYFNATDKLILFAGRLDPVKGLSYLIAAFKSMMEQDPTVRLIVVGDGNLKPYFDDSTPFWSRVTFTGFIQKECLYDFYCITDMGVLPSLHEEFGYVALEMMMMGLPLVVSQTTGLQELVINNETGTVVSLDHSNESKEIVITCLQQAISALLYDTARQERYRRNSRRRFLENYETEHFRQEIANFYCSCVEDFT